MDRVTLRAAAVTTAAAAVAAAPDRRLTAVVKLEGQ